MNNQNFVLGWDIKQWARVLALHEGEKPTSFEDIIEIQKNYKINNLYEPCGDTIIIGAKPKYDYDTAMTVMLIAYKKLKEVLE